MTNPAALGPAPSPARPAPAPAASTGTPPGPAADPVLCQHCGRTATNGISCQGICVADSGY
ncbi:MAG: hypothetical protein FJ082_05520 [Cyanobacteria bacterium K_Offshore_surface_m2_011]|nr:hypothetical protein [Cyanobacteria bacterium K_Offshore_surface_m2_011]